MSQNQPQNSPIKVVHIITRFILGGAQENTLLTVIGLNKNPKYKVTLVTGPAIGPEGELIERVKQNNIDLIIIDQMRRNIYPRKDLITFVKLFFLLRRLRPDIVHTHSAKAGILGRIAARLAGVKIVIHTVHGLPFHPYQFNLANIFYIALERFTALFTTKFITVADAMTEQSLKAKVGSREMYTTIYSAMELDKFRPAVDADSVRKSLGLSEDDKVIGTIARLAKLKGHHYLLKIAEQVISKVSQAKFLFVGDGNLKEQILKEVKDRGLIGRVIFTGLVEPDRIPSLIEAMDVLVHPSLREGLARALPQALALGKPVISFDIDGAREVVLNGKTGFLIVPPSNQDETAALKNLAESIIYLLQHPDEASKMGKAGQELVQRNFNADYMVERIQKVYKQELDLIVKTAKRQKP
ncbi:MAG: glycosyltransferase family 4 protein [Planctomycetes bacterium]|nr:glycosyltransferase family 4 protein [Planctomycetota bacterium]